MESEYNHGDIVYLKTDPEQKVKTSFKSEVFLASETPVKQQKEKKNNKKEKKNLYN